MSIHKKMIAIMSEIGSIGKDQQNQQQRFNYRGIDDVYNVLHKIMAKHGVFSVPTVMDKRREERTNKNGTVLAFTTLTMKYTFYAEDGSSVECVVEGEGMDSGDKSSNKAMAVAHKYALLQCFCIPTAEQKDPDAETFEVKPSVISVDQASELNDLIADSQTDVKRFLQHFSGKEGYTINSVEELPERAYKAAKTMLNKKLQEAA